MVRRHWGRDDDRIDRVVREHILEVGGHPRGRVSLRKVGAPLVVDVAEPGEVAELVEVAGEVPAPLAQAYLRYASHNFHTLPLPVPFLPVAFLRSTTTCARSTRSA